MVSLEDARNNMVDSQLRPTKVNDKRVIEAMRRLPREAFIPDTARALAYSDVEVPLGGGRVLLPPLVVARMIQATAIACGDRVLVLGAGYAAAVFAAMGAEVTAIDTDEDVLSRARAAYAAADVAVAIQKAPLATGWPAGAPYACIFIDGAVRTLPNLGEQLRHHPPGRLCALLAGDSRSGVAIVAEQAGQGPHVVPRPIMDCAATLMPQFVQPAQFVF